MTGTRRGTTRTWGFSAALMAAMVAVGGLNACARDVEKEKGWVSLFDGKSLEGWTKVGNKESKWEVKDGAIQGSGPSSMLVTDKGGFKNFRFRVEVKINDHGNSGMYFRTTAKPGFTDGVECQINSSHADPIRTGSIYTHVHIFEDLVPPDTWFTQEVEVEDMDYRGKIVTSVKVKVNGKLLYQFLDYERQFKEGHFAFQQHDPGSRVSIRKAEVMPLPDKTPGK